MSTSNLIKSLVYQKSDKKKQQAKDLKKSWALQNMTDLNKATTSGTTQAGTKRDLVSSLVFSPKSTVNTLNAGALNKLAGESANENKLKKDILSIRAGQGLSAKNREQIGGIAQSVGTRTGSQATGTGTGKINLPELRNAYATNPQKEDSGNKDVISRSGIVDILLRKNTPNVQIGTETGATQPAARMVDQALTKKQNDGKTDVISRNGIIDLMSKKNTPSATFSGKTNLPELPETEAIGAAMARQAGLGALPGSAALEAAQKQQTATEPGIMPGTIDLTKAGKTEPVGQAKVQTETKEPVYTPGTTKSARQERFDAQLPDVKAQLESGLAPKRNLGGFQLDEESQAMLDFVNWSRNAPDWKNEKAYSAYVNTGIEKGYYNDSNDVTMKSVQALNDEIKDIQDEILSIDKLRAETELNDETAQRYSDIMYERDKYLKLADEGLYDFQNGAWDYDEHKYDYYDPLIYDTLHGGTQEYEDFMNSDAPEAEKRAVSDEMGQLYGILSIQDHDKRFAAMEDWLDARPEAEEYNKYEILYNTAQYDSLVKQKKQREEELKRRETKGQLEFNAMNGLDEADTSYHADRGGQYKGFPKNSKTGIPVISGDKADQIYYEANHTVEEVAGKSVKSSASQLGWSPYYFMDDNMVATFNAYYNRGDKKTALEYAQSCLPFLENRQSEYEDFWTKEQASGGWGWLYSIATIPTKSAYSLLSTGATLAALLGDEAAADKNNWAYKGTHKVDLIRAIRQEKFDDTLQNWFGENWKGTGNFLLGVGYSVADNVYNMMVSKGIGNAANKSAKVAKWVMNALMFSESAGSAMVQCLYNDMDPTEAAWRALGSGAIELITEQWSIDRFMNFEMKFGTKGEFFKYMIGNLVPEASEEMASDLLNTGLDELLSAIYDHRSELAEAYDAAYVQFLNQTHDPERAKQLASQKVRDDYLNGLLISGAGGALGAVPMSVFGAGTNMLQYKQLGSLVRGNNQHHAQNKSSMDVIKTAMSMKPDTESNRLGNIANQKVQEGKRVGDIEIGRLTRAIMAESSEKVRSATMDSVRSIVSEQMEKSGMAATEAKKYGDIVAKAIANDVGSLTKSERKNLMTNDVAFAVYQRMTEPEAMGKHAKGVNAAEEIVGKVQEDVAGKTASEQKNASAIRSILQKEVYRKALQKGIVKTDGVANTRARQTAKIASAETIQNAEGTKTGSAAEVVANGKIGIIEGFKNGKVQIRTQDGAVTEHELADVETVDENAGTLISYMRSLQGVMSDNVAGKAIAGLAAAGEKAGGRFAEDVVNINFAARTGMKMPNYGSMDQETAHVIYDTAKADAEAAEQARLKNDAVLKPGEGKASWDGAEYGTEAWNEKLKTLDKGQRNQAEVVAQFAKLAGFNVQFINDTNKTDMYGSYNGGGNITINLAGKDTDGTSHHLLTVAGHETTHWLEQNSKEGYATLKKFVLDSLEKSGVNLQALIQNKMDAYNKYYADNKMDRTMTIDDAIYEVVADGCDQILSSQEFANRLKQTDAGLFQKIKTHVQELIGRIKTAVKGMIGSGSYEGREMLKDVDEMAKIWLGGYDEVIHGAVTGETQTQGNRAEYAIRDTYGNEVRLNDHEIENNKKTVSDMKPVISITGGKFQKNADADFKTMATNYFKEIGGKAESKIFGTVNLNESGVKHLVGWLTSRRAGILEAIKPVIENGELIHLAEKGQGHDFDSAIVAAPIELDGKPYYMAVVIRQDGEGKNSYYMHDAIVAEINRGQLPVNKSLPSQTLGSNPTIDMILRTIPYYNGISGTNEQLSIRENDDAYMQAVENGNTEEAQRMVDDAAKAAGYITPKLYHGTRDFQFTEFDTTGHSGGMIFATSDRRVAETYSGETQRSKISDRTKIDVWKLHGNELLEEAKKHLKRYNDYRLANNEERERAKTDARADLKTYANEIADIVKKNADQLNDFARGKAEEIADRLMKVSEAKTDDEMMDAWNKYESAAWMFKWENEDFLYEMLSDDRSQFIYTAKNKLSDFLYDGDIYIQDEYGDDRIFDNQLALELNADLHKGVYELYGNPGKQLVIDAKGNNWNNINPPEELNLFGTQRTRDIAEAAKALGYDSVMIKNLRDSGGETPYNAPSDVYIFFDPNQMKSADPVTYNDNGNVIPLSERFNDKNNDIRYSIADESTRKYLSGWADWYADQLAEERDKILRKYGITGNGMAERGRKMSKSDQAKLNNLEREIDKWENYKVTAMGLDEEDLGVQYVRAWRSFDTERMEEILMERMLATDGIIPYKAPNWYDSQKHRDVAQQIKNGDPYAIMTAAVDMANLVPKNAVLIPMPPHTGKVTDTTDTMLLARKISELTGRPVINALEGNERMSRKEAKAAGVNLDAAAMGFRKTAEIPEGTIPYFIDNVVGSGVTAQAAHEAFGAGITLAYAKSTRAGIEGLKNVGATYIDPRQSWLVPLDAKMNMDRNDVQGVMRYSINAPIDQAYMEAVNNGDMKQAMYAVEDVADENGYTIRAYHGTGRADRVGTVFLPERATSGPMAFFTDNREIAEGYARDKRDTSIAYDDEYGDYFNQFRVNVRGKNVPVGKLWGTLNFAERQKITEAAKHITMDDDMEEIIYDENAQHGIGNFDDYERKLHGWNSIDTLIEGWLNGGALYGREGDFIKVLELAGIKGVTWNNPDARDEKVYDVFLKIQNPFATNEMYNQKFLDDLAKWWAKQDQSKYSEEGNMADMWDKRNITMEEWMDDARRDIENGNTYTWTRIHDAVSDYLKEKGYDGIKDEGGKGGGNGHTVWIPFTSEQIKSADPVTYDDQGNIIPPSERFNSEKKDIRWSINTPADMDVNYWMMSTPESALRTEAEKQLLRSYKGIRLKLELDNEKIKGYEKRIATMEASADKLTQAEKRQLQGLKIRLENARSTKAVHEQQLAEVTSAEGFGGMMMYQNKVMNDVIGGRTQDEVQKTVERMEKTAEETKARLDAEAAELDRIAKDKAVQQIMSRIGKTSLDRMAAWVRKNYGSTMNKQEIQNELAKIALKMEDGQDFAQDVEDLAGRILEGIPGEGGEYLDQLRGLTIRLGKGQMAELFGKDSGLKEVRRQLAGTGIKVVDLEAANKRLEKEKGGKANLASLDAQWDELCDKIPALDRNTSEKDQLGALIDFAISQRDAREKGGRQMYAEMLPQVMIDVQAAAMAVDVDKPMDPAAKKQIAKLQQIIVDLTGKTSEAAKRMQEMSAEVDELIARGKKAVAWTDAMKRDAQTTIDYFDRVSKLAVETAKQNKQDAIIQQLKDKYTQQMLKQNQEWRDLIERDRNARRQAEDNQAERRKINTVVNRIAKLLSSPKGDKNIPEHMQALARHLIEQFVDSDLADSGRKVTLIERGQLQELKRRLTAWNERDGEFDIGDIRTEDDEEHPVKWMLLNDLNTIYNGLEKWNGKYNGKNKLDTLKQMGETLTEMQSAVSEIYNIIHAEQTVNIRDRQIAIEDQAFKVREGTEGKKKKEWAGKVGQKLGAMHKFIVSGNMTPEYFFRTIGNAGLNDLWGEYHNAENRNGLELAKTKAKLAEIAKQHGYDTWDMNKRLTVQLEKGGTVQMTVGQLMSLWATWNREMTLGPEMSEHLTKGGFYVEENDPREGIARRVTNEKRAHRISVERDSEGRIIGSKDMDLVSSLLTDEQKAFVNDVVAYMSNDLSALGNEASMKAYGIKLYKEKYYFPFQMWDGIKNRKSNDSGNAVNQDRAFHPSFSKSRLHGANNALVLGDFMQTAADHAVGMINYATMGLANETMNKVLNHKVREAADGDTENYTTRNIRTIMEEAYGKEAMQYLRELQVQLNGGAVNTNKTVGDKIISMFRKNAVAGSLSVALQQPLSYIRAAMMINPKYLTRALSPDMWKGSYKEMLAHSGVAVIKDMGRFDMNFGQSAREYVSPDQKKGTAKKVWDTATKYATIAPEWMDRMTWTRMWSAVKAEQAALHPEMDVKSDEFLDMVGERFNDLMRRTQVYDSVLVKSENMRSQHYWMKGLTSFMAEPTLTMNVLADSMRMAIQGEKGGKAMAAKAGATFLLSAVLQAAVKGVMGAGRNPDEKKTWWENFLYRFGNAYISEVNPLGLIPGYSDLVSLLKEGELSDDAMGALGKIVSVKDTAIDMITGKYKKGNHRGWEDTAGQLMQLFTNMPLKNIMRDGRAMYNFITQPYADRETSADVLKWQAMDQIHNAESMLGVLNKWLKEAGYETTNTAYYKRIFQAKKEGDEAKANSMIEYLLKGRGVKEATINKNITDLAKQDKDLEMAEKAAFLSEEGNEPTTFVLNRMKKDEITPEEARKILKEQNPNMDDDTIWWKVDKALYNKETGKSAGNSKYYRLWYAMDANKAEDIGKAISDMVEHGVNPSDIKGQVTSHYKKAYLAADNDGKQVIRDAIHKAYKKMNIDPKYADEIIDRWK